MSVAASSSHVKSLLHCIWAAPITWQNSYITDLPHAGGCAGRELACHPIFDMYVSRRSSLMVQMEEEGSLNWPSSPSSFSSNTQSLLPLGTNIQNTHSLLYHFYSPYLVASPPVRTLREIYYFLQDQPLQDPLHLRPP
jgi:hypothetical protein